MENENNESNDIWPVMQHLKQVVASVMPEF